MGTPIFTGDVFQWARFCNGKERNFDRKKLPMFAIIIIFVIIIMILFIYVVPSLHNLLLDY